MQLYMLVSFTGLIFLCIGKDNMISQATTVQWGSYLCSFNDICNKNLTMCNSGENNKVSCVNIATPFNEARLASTKDEYVTSNSSVKFNRLNRVKAKWSGNDIWEAQARHATNYTMNAYSTTSTSPPKRGSFPKSKRRKGSQSDTEGNNGRLPIKRIPAKIKKAGQLHRRTRPISQKKGSITTTTPAMTTRIYSTTTKMTSTTLAPKRGNVYGNYNMKANAKVKSASISLDTGGASKHKYKRKPARPVIRVTVTDPPIRNETEMTSVAVSSTTTTTASTPKTTTTMTTTTKTPHSPSPTKMVTLPTHLTKRPILPSRTMTKKTTTKTTTTPAPALSTTTQKYYPKTSNTLLSLLSASTTPAVTIPNTPFLFMEDNSFLTRLSISLFYSSIAIAPVIFTLFSGLATSKRKRKKRDLFNLSPLHSSADHPLSFQNHLNPYYNQTHRPPPYPKDSHYPHQPRRKSLPHFLAELLKEIESTLHTKATAR